MPGDHIAPVASLLVAMSKDITLRINRLHASIWKDIAKNLKLVTIVKLLSLRLPKLQYEIDSLTIDTDESVLFEMAICMVDILPKLKHVRIHEFGYVDNDIREQFNRLMTKLSDRDVTIYSSGSRLIRGFMNEFTFSFFTHVTQFSFPNLTPTKMSTDGALTTIPPTITELDIDHIILWEMLPDSITSLNLNKRVTNGDIFKDAPPNLTKLSYRTYEQVDIKLPDSVIDLSINIYNRRLTEISANIVILNIKVNNLTKDVIECLHSGIAKLTMSTSNISDITVLNSIPAIESITIYFYIHLRLYDFESIKERYHVIITDNAYIIKNRMIC